MAVNLSPIWGAGAQLLDNSGNVLSGGKIYTYAAGTTTPATTYTSSSGITANSNPIILNSAGRVPYEIWLTDGISYKFVLKDSNDTLIATYDNLTGINSNFIAYTAQQEIQTATAGQTVFTLTTMQYQPATNNLSVFVDGVNQYGPGAQYAYVETSSTVVTFVSGLHVGASVKFTTASPVSSSSTDAQNVSYEPPFTGSVGTNVADKLAQTVSVKDFGAVGDGVTDDTAAIQAAIDYAVSIKGELNFSSATYRISDTLTVDAPIDIYGNRAQIYQETADKDLFLLAPTVVGGIMNTMLMQDLILATAAGIGIALRIRNTMSSTFDNITIIAAGAEGIKSEASILNTYRNCRVGGTMNTTPGFFVGGVGNLTTRCFSLTDLDGNLGYATGSNGNSFIQCYAQTATETSYYIDGGNSNSFISCDSEYASGAFKNHFNAIDTTTLNIVGGVYEGEANITIDSSNDTTITGVFCDNIINVKSGSVNTNIIGGLIKQISIQSGAISTSIDGVSLYVGAGGIADSGTNTFVGTIYDNNTANAYAGRKWRKSFTPKLSIGGTTTGHTITSALGNAYAKDDGTIEIVISMSWSAFNNTTPGNVAIDCSEILGAVPSGTRFSILAVGGLRATLGASYGWLYADIGDSNGLLRIIKSPITTAAGAVLQSSELYSADNGIKITGIIQNVGI